jgi:hypothetical protein
MKFPGGVDEPQQLSRQPHSLSVGQSRQARSPAHLGLDAVSCPDRQLIGNGRHASESLRSQLLVGLIGVALQWRSCLELQDCFPLKRPMMVRRWEPALPSRVLKPRGAPCRWDLEKSSQPPNGLGSESLPEPRFPSPMSDIISLTSTHCTYLANGPPHMPSAELIARSRYFPAIASQPVIMYYRRAELVSDVLGAWPSHWPGPPFSSDGCNSDLSHLAGHSRGRLRVSGRTPAADQGAIKSAPSGPTLKPQHN